MTQQPTATAHAAAAAPSHGGGNSESAATASSWLRNLQRGSVGGGFWSDAAWYDAHISQRMPQYDEMVRRLVLSLPPLEPNARVLDWLSGSGMVAAAVAHAYPDASFTLLDSDARRLDRARTRFQREALPTPTLLQHMVTPQHALPPANDGHGTFALVTACLALHHLMEHAPSTSERESSFTAWARSLLGVLKPGGHLFVGDHTGQLRLAVQLRLLHDAGFVDVDVAWRVDDMFVIGCRRPLEHSEAHPSQAHKPAVATPVASSTAEARSQAASDPSAPTAAATASDHPAVAPSAAAASDVAIAAASASVDAVATPAVAAASSHPQRQSWMEDDEISQMIAALQAQNEELKARLAVAPAATQQPSMDESSTAPTVAANANPASAASAADGSSSSSSGGPSAALLAKLPLLFSRFDPSRSGQLTYAALQSLCRAVGRDVDDGEDSLWWTYQSIAQADPETGNIGIAIEDLTQHFYKAPGMWSLSDDLHKLGII